MEEEKKIGGVTIEELDNALRIRKQAVDALKDALNSEDEAIRTDGLAFLVLLSLDDIVVSALIKTRLAKAQEILKDREP